MACSNEPAIVGYSSVNEIWTCIYVRLVQSMDIQDCLIMAQPWTHTMTTRIEYTHQCESPSIPRLIHCHFAHKIDTLNLKQQIFASPTLSSSATTIPSSYRPSVASQWDSWRRHSEEQRTDEDEDNGIGGQGEFEQHHRRHYQDQESGGDDSQGSYSEEEDLDQYPPPTNRKHKGNSHVSVSSISGDSLGSGRRYGSSQSQSSSSRSAEEEPSSQGSSTGRGRFRKPRSKGHHRRRKSTEPSSPKGPGRPLPESSHHNKEQRRLDSADPTMSRRSKSGRSSKNLVDELRPEEQAIHYKQLYEDEKRRTAQALLDNQRQHVAMIADTRVPIPPPADNNADGDDFYDGALDNGDNTAGSADFLIVASTFKKSVYRKVKFGSPNTEDKIASMVLDSMGKKGFMYVPGPKTSPKNRSKCQLGTCASRI